MLDWHRFPFQHGFRLTPHHDPWSKSTLFSLPLLDETGASGVSKWDEDEEVDHNPAVCK